MRINLQNTVEKFSGFVRSLDKSAKKQLVSFAFKVDDYDVLFSINSLTSVFKEVFLFKSPDSKYSFIALNTAMKISNSEQNKILEAAKKYEQIKNSFINNWSEIDLDSLPIICTAVKFDSIKNSDDWSDFEAVKIFIPELAFYTNNGNTYGCFNFINNEESQTGQLVDYFLNQLTSIKETIDAKKSKIEKNDGCRFYEDENELSLWLNTSGEAIDVLSNGIIQKLVISRAHSFQLIHEPNWENLLKKLSIRFPDCYLFYLKQNKSHFFGSSPELFLKIFGNLAEVESVAGSAPRGEKFESDEMLEQYLQSSKKNHKEHKYVTDFISDTLKKYSDKVIIKENKHIKKLDNIQHLATKISAELKSYIQILKIVDALFPTPAVCGLPKDEAMGIIRKLETHDRGLYSGLIGWMDFEGNCELAVAIRSTLVKNNKVTAYAGAGLVKDSNLEEEFIETKLKLDPVLSLFKPQAYD
jgi:menaquinone-specific isochorismate synthase